jgi:hypothetical protein
MPKIKIVPTPGVKIAQGYVMINLRQHIELLVTGPGTRYHDLMVSIDNQPERMIARWCDPFQPHRFVVWQPEILEARTLALRIKLYPEGEIPE